MLKHQKGFLRAVKAFFCHRRLIIVSDKSVQHIPINGAMQLGIAVLVLGTFSGISYMTGSYMAASSAMQQKDEQLESTAEKNRRMGAEYSLLKKDLLTLQNHQGELSDYAQFIIDQHTKNTDMELLDSFADASGTSKKSADAAALQERIDYLQKRIEDLKDANDRIVTEVERRSENRISGLKSVLGMTGLDSGLLKRGYEQKQAAIAREDAKNEGGPFIPDHTSELAPDLFKKMDEMAVLDGVVQQLPLAMPVDSPRLTSPFGRRVDPFTGRWAVHSGQDFVGVNGAPIHATSAGRVIHAGRSNGYGNMVEIDHGMGVTSLYGHLSSIAVSEGQQVKLGQTVGRQGSTGRSTGQHLHYEVRLNDRPLDPRNFIKAGFRAKEIPKISLSKR